MAPVELRRRSACSGADPRSSPRCLDRRWCPQLNADMFGDVTDEDPRNPLGIDWTDLVGKYALVGITYRDMRGTMLNQEQLHGRITQADPTRGLTLQLEGVNAGKTYALPPDLRSLRVADPGEYRLRSTGEVVRDPDVLVTWIIEQPDG